MPWHYVATNLALMDGDRVIAALVRLDATRDEALALIAEGLDEIGGRDGSHDLPSRSLGRGANRTGCSASASDPVRRELIRNDDG